MERLTLAAGEGTILGIEREDVKTKRRGETLHDHGPELCASWLATWASKRYYNGLAYKEGALDMRHAMSWDIFRLHSLTCLGGTLWHSA